jgi:hypothetical protein
MTNAYGKFVDLLISRGWWYEDTRLPDGFKQNEKAMVIGSYRYPTFLHPELPVKVALIPNPLSVFKGEVFSITSWGSKIRSVTMVGIVSAERKKGYGERAVRDLMTVADAVDCFLMLEPGPIKGFAIKGQRSITRRKLVEWYARLGFIPTYRDEDAVMHYPNKPFNGE